MEYVITFFFLLHSIPQNASKETVILSSIRNALLLNLYDITFNLKTTGGYSKKQKDIFYNVNVFYVETTPILKD